MEFSRPEYWSGQPFPSPGDLLDPGIKPGSPALQADSLPTELSGKPVYTFMYVYIYVCLSNGAMKSNMNRAYFVDFFQNNHQMIFFFQNNHQILPPGSHGKILRCS